MYVKTFLMKFIMTFALMLIVLGWYYDVGLLNVLITTIALTVLGYIGDIFLLPRIGNTLATMGDFVLAILVVYGVGMFLYEEIPVGTAAFVISILLIVGEMFLHQYIETKVFEPQTTDPRDKKGYYERVGLYNEYAEYKQKMNK